MGKTKLLPLALGGLAIGTTEFVMMGLLPNIAHDFQVTIPQVGYVISGYALGVVIGAPLLAVVGGGVPPKRMLMLLMLLFAVFNTLSAFAPNNTVLFVTRLLSGLPHGAFFGVGSVVASRLAEQGKQAQAISIMFAGLTVANLLMVPIGTYIGHYYSWRYTLAGVGLIGLLTVLAVQLVLPALEPEQNGSIAAQMKAFNKLETWLIVLLTAIGTGGLFCWISYIAPLLTEVSGFEADQVPYILMVAGLGMVVGNVVGGKLADRLNPLNASLVLLLTMAATLLIIYFVAESRALSILMTFIAGGCSLAVAAPIQIMMINASKGAETLGASVTQAAFNIGNALGAFLGGLPIAAGWGYTSPALVGVGLALAGAGFALALVRLHAGKAQPEPVAQPVAG
ncbi:MFS transporter [Hymenobacter metallicola]|uniref:MFS transporter n=1 Tax=Hymenobacter metallicola TaxID=2563114 RepID=A0A4Z0QC96_9BACT|nr:MFS transporter [Hymenobacter metallicola]TGE27677.1 MFS transporter [Hymenobacter metallicola]